MDAAAAEATWRVYLREWLTVYTSDEVEVMGKAECNDHFARTYAGRVRREDMRVQGAVGFRPQRQVLQIRLWNLKGEFKDQAEAVLLAEDIAAGWHGPHLDSGTAQAVQRGSAQEQVMLDYGRKMLPDAG